MKRGNQNSEIGHIAIVIIHFMWKKRNYDLSFYFVNLLFRPIMKENVWVFQDRQKISITRTGIKNGLYKVQLENVKNQVQINRGIQNLNSLFGHVAKLSVSPPKICAKYRKHWMSEFSTVWADQAGFGSTENFVNFC